MVELFREMSDLTAPECARLCRAPHSCCSPEYCDMAEAIASDAGENIVPTGHATLKFMGPTGCVVPPHFRPLCTLHTCDVNGVGYKPDDDEWNRKYFTLRNKIEDEAWK